MDGYKFDSLAEARRYAELKILLGCGRISDLRVHPKFAIEHCGVKICTVELDFQYAASGNGVPEWKYEDVKRERRDSAGKLKFSTDTRHSKIGRKLLKAFYGISVEVIK